MKILITILICFIYTTGFGKTITVGKNRQHPSIKSAVNKAVAGDTILIDEGVYKEGQIILTKALVLRGVNYPVLDGEKKYEILTIKANGVVVEGIVFRNSGRSSYMDIAALRIADSRFVTVKNNRFEFAFFGIYSQHATSCTITGNKLTSDAKDEINSANGIHCWKSDSMKIEGNTITGHRDGIYFEFVTNSFIKGNTSYLNVRYGIHFMFSNNDTYVNNTFKNNGAGVAVMYSNHINMHQNLFADNWGSAAYGILLKDISDGTISGNTFRNNSVGVMMEGSSRLQIEKNTFSSNGWALKIQANCADNLLTHNNFTGNSFDVATNGDLVLSRFEKNYWDKYDGYDLNRNGVGDVPYHPVSLYAMITERNPSSMMMYRSFMATLIDKIEKVMPVLTPVELKDHHPLMKPVKF
ncbi:nitrous oxide reductase family maturation protein NosD [Lacibacter sp. MH-610]|uniref:nitrous oxide reductase family maturation protein NosD n=1 Tax=Lacibacter sp. MH-610 TaxID=3020883 RepID=UPI003892B50B